MDLNDAGERRRRPQVIETAALSRRTPPTMFVVDGKFRVLHWHISASHARERRAELKLVTKGGRLPPAIGKAVSELAAAFEASPRAAVVVHGELIVRLERLESTGEPGAFAVFVEPFKGRDHLTRAKERFKLTKREAQVLELLIAGARTRDVASELVIAESTAIFHVKQLFEKSGARNRLELISKATA